LNLFVMRLRRTFPWLATFAVVVAAGLWWHERGVTAALQARADTLAGEERKLARRQNERERVRRELGAAGNSAGAPGVAVAPAAESPPPPPPAWSPGEWMAAAEWRNEGRATPRATVATLLWAATGGDLVAMRNTLQFDDTTRRMAHAWYDSLPLGGRSLYATPEDLVAAATLASIPTTQAQLSWLHETDQGRAIVGILVAEPAAGAPSTPGFQPAVDNFPPMLTGPSRYRVVVLNLQRTLDGWRVNVPATAIDRLAKAAGVTGDR
jgi:hypothetical protein